MTNLNDQILDVLQEKLRELFREVTTEDKIDFDKLKQIRNCSLRRGKRSLRTMDLNPTVSKTNIKETLKCAGLEEEAFTII